VRVCNALRRVCRGEERTLSGLGAADSGGEMDRVGKGDQERESGLQLGLLYCERTLGLLASSTTTEQTTDRQQTEGTREPPSPNPKKRRRDGQTAVEQTAADRSRQEQKAVVVGQTAADRSRQEQTAVVAGRVTAAFQRACIQHTAW
jgi:hypothetical protein